MGFLLEEKYHLNTQFQLNFKLLTLLNKQVFNSMGDIISIFNKLNLV